MSFVCIAFFGRLGILSCLRFFRSCLRQLRKYEHHFTFEAKRIFSFVDSELKLKKPEPLILCGVSSKFEEARAFDFHRLVSLKILFGIRSAFTHGLIQRLRLGAAVAKI